MCSGATFSRVRPTTHHGTLPSPRTSSSSSCPGSQGLDLADAPLPRDSADAQIECIGASAGKYALISNVFSGKNVQPGQFDAVLPLRCLTSGVVLCTVLHIVT